MCSHYEAPGADRLREVYGTSPDQQFKLDLWPGYVAPFVRLRDKDSLDDSPSKIDVCVGVFGLLPRWAKDTKLSRRTYNARSETVAEKNSFKAAWKTGKHAIVLASAIYEPDWRSGKAVPTRISRKDGGLMGIAGLWESWIDPATRDEVLSFTMLTVNADSHPLMNQYHRPGDERRMVVVLPNGLHNDWLSAKPEQSMDFMREYPADRLIASANS